LTKGLFEKLADEASDRFFDGASIVKKLVSSAVQFADVNHQMRQAGLAGLGGAQNTKDKGKPSNGQKCRESTDGEKSWGPCEY
jgi:hypothetical protein